VYHSDELSERMKASPLKHADLLSTGLDASEAVPEAESAERVLARLLDERLAPVLERLDGKPDTGEVRHMIREEVERVAGQSHA
jgi:hypothetical protein